MQSQQSPVRSTRSKRHDNADELVALLALDTSHPRPAPRAQPAATGSEQTAEPVDDTPKLAFEKPSSLNGIFALYQEFVAKVSDLATDARFIERELFGRGWSAVIETPKSRYVRDLAQDALTNLVRQAQSKYAPEAGTLEINPFDVLRATGQERWAEIHARTDDDNVAPLDLDKIRSYLDETYGGDAGETEAYRQQAKHLIDYFGFARGDGNMAATSKHVACTVRMYSEKKAYGDNKGMLELGYHRREDLPKLFKALSCAFAATGHEDLASELRRPRMLDWNFCYKSRQRESFTGLDVVLYAEKWEWQFTHDAANALKLFLGQYGA
jgi:hypothetical protein